MLLVNRIQNRCVNIDSGKIEIIYRLRIAHGIRRLLNYHASFSKRRFGN
jgi:hypothetical protein